MMAKSLAQTVVGALALTLTLFLWTPAADAG